jgi:hypothetical protein
MLRGVVEPFHRLRLAAAFVSLLAFVLVEVRKVRPMVEFGLLRRRTFVGTVLAMIDHGGSAQVMVFFLLLYLENACRFEALTAGGQVPGALSYPSLIVAGRYRGIGRTLAATFRSRKSWISGAILPRSSSSAKWPVSNK